MRLHEPASGSIAHVVPSRGSNVTRFATRPELAKRLGAFAASDAGAHVEGVVRGRIVSRNARLVLVFSGNGSQWQGMGRRLLATDRLFRRHVKKVDDLLRRLTGFGILEELNRRPEDSRLHLTEIAQPLVFALQIGLFETLVARGLVVEAVLGHSVGEVAAAYAAGAFDLPEAVGIIHHRSAAQALTRGLGRMAAVGLSHADAMDEMIAFGDDLELAAVHSPTSVTLSGPLPALEELQAGLRERNVFCRILDLDYAFHSKVMDVVRKPLLRSLAGLRPRPLSCAFVSTVTGRMTEGRELDANYWWENIRSPVRLDEAVARLVERDFGVFLEVGPHPIMQGYIRENLSATGSKAQSLPTLQKDADDEVSLWRALCGVQVLGCPVDARKLFRHRGDQVALPLYPWQREFHWHNTTNEALGALGPPLEHPLLGHSVQQAEGIWESQLDVERFPYLADHVVGDAVMFPGTGFTEIALAAAEVRSAGTSHELRWVEFRAPLVFEGTAVKTVRFKLGEDGSFSIRSRPRLSDQPWTLNVVGRLGSPFFGKRPARIDIGCAMSTYSRKVSSAEHYRRAKVVGLLYGQAFQGVKDVWTSGDEAFARLALSEPVTDQAQDYLMHPALLDSCLQVLVVLCASDVDPRRPVCFLPFHVGRMVYYGPGGTAVFCRATIQKRSARSVVARFQIFDDQGETLAELEGFRFRRARWIPEAAGVPACYAYRLVPRPLPHADRGDTLPHPSALATQLSGKMDEHWRRYHRSDFYGSALPLMDAMVAAFVDRTVRGLAGVESGFTLDSLMSTGGIDPRQRRLLSRLLEVLREDGVFNVEGSEWTFSEDSRLPDPEASWRQLLAEFPGLVRDVTVAGRWGMHLPDLLRGTSRNLASKSNVGVTANLCDASPTWRMVNLAVREALVEIVGNCPEGRRLRILELGCGAVGLTADLLRVLPMKSCRYVFASPDEAVRAQARAELGDFDGHVMLDLDIVADLTEQGQDANSFDIVIASHVLHALDEPETALDNIHRLLDRDGLLLVLERSPERVADLVFGAEPEWWSRTIDGEGLLSRLRSTDEWQTALEKRGFVEVSTIAEPVETVAPRTYLLVSRNPEASLPDVDTPERVGRSCLILSDESGLSRTIADHLTANLLRSGHRPIRVIAGEQFSRPGEAEFVVSPESPADFERLVEILGTEDRGADEIVHLIGLSFEPDGAATDVMEIQNRRCLSAIHLVQAYSGLEATSWPRLWLVTAGAAGVGADKAAIPSQAPLWGLGRVFANEHPDLRCRRVDLCQSLRPETAAQRIMEEMVDPDEEDEVVLGDGVRYGMRLERVDLDAPEFIDRVDPDQRTRLHFSNPGRLGNLRWFAERRMFPESDQIEVRVRSTGLNFRDVMYTMGMLSDEAVEDGFAGATLGMECAGDVIGIGSNVTDFAVGDPVMCFARGCFASHVTTPITAVARIPDGLTYEEAATIPSVFFTAYYALGHLARLEAGERVLIHGAAGGVGLATVQIARHRGAEIFATAGSDEKRDFLRLLGVDHILDSRSLAFADQILDITNGEGVDVVLNSISGEAVSRNLEVLKPFGRFLELGKRDFYENTKIGLRPFRNNITYFGIDADQLMKTESALAGRLFGEVMELFRQGALRPLPYRVFPSSRVADAFRHMQQSLQIGKIVVVYEDSLEVIRESVPAAAEFRLDRTASYLVTGGLGGFGLATARWMVARGARSLILVGRSGAATPEARAAVTELEATGARVEVCRVDVTRLDDLRELFGRIERDLPSLKGVVHGAMVLEDRLVRNLDRDSLDRVLAPKIQGAWNLHEVTRDLSLDFFVLHSSASTTLGHPGQANYVAANMYVESLAEYRRDLGLPAIAVGWGPLGDVGILAGNRKVLDALFARIGGQVLHSTQALGQLERLLEADRTGVAVVDLDWRKLVRSMPGIRSVRFRGLGGRRGEEGGDGDIHSLIEGLTEDEALETVTRLLLEQMATVLRLPASKIGVAASIYDLGMDSLMAVELLTAIQSRFGIRIPTAAMTEGLTVAQIAARIALELSPGSLGARGGSL